MFPEKKRLNIPPLIGLSIKDATITVSKYKYKYRINLLNREIKNPDRDFDCWRCNLFVEDGIVKEVQWH